MTEILPERTYQAPEGTTSVLSSSFSPDWVSPPGDTIADLLEERDWTQLQLSERMEYTTKHISLLINGKAPITEETAVKLSRVLGGSEKFWLNREANYRASSITSSKV